MSEEKSFEELFNEEPLKTIRNGEVVTGRVIEVKPGSAYLNIGFKSDGLLTAEEYSRDAVDLTTVLNVDDEVTVKVLRVNEQEGIVTVSHRRVAPVVKGNDTLKEAYENNTPVKAVVSKVVPSKGLSVDVEGTPVFIPASLISDGYEKDLSKYQDMEIEFYVTEYKLDTRRPRIIGNRRQLVQERKASAAEELFTKIAVGDAVEGTVKNITDFGAFVDLGGADGLLHISEMSWGRVENPKKVFTVGQTLRVLIKEINGEKIALSLKFPGENPWKEAETKYAVGNKVSGKVARMTDFGAFIELEPGIDALLHVSQISHSHIAKPSDALKIGQEVETQVVTFNAEDQRISLSMKALEPAPVEAPKAEEAAPAEEVVEIPVVEENVNSMAAAVEGLTVE
ncbi:MAG: S1 RNA-binding domain-containing protein [Lachnospiraceae bacterium]|nr:S1 RNA-binding domain-containing protein [Candidatus Equihabitans merdae]